MRWGAVGLYLGLVILNCHQSCWAKPNLEAKIHRLEQLVESKINIRLVNQLESLQQEVLELRGMLELQEHNLQLLNKRQEQLAVDLNSRLSSSANLAKSSTAPLVDTDQQVSNTIQDDNIEQEQLSYELAFKLMQKQKYTESLTSFKDFLWQYPQSKLVPNVHYWLGEIYLSKWQQDQTKTDDLNQAITEFEQLSHKFSQHNKAVDAVLKLGLIKIESQEWQDAEQILDTLTKKYSALSRIEL